MQKAAKKKVLASPVGDVDQAVRDGIATAYLEHGNLLDGLGYIEIAQISYRKAEKWGSVQRTNQVPSPSGLDGAQVRDIAHIPSTIFNQDLAPAVAKYDLPRAGVRLTSTAQLAYCLSLLPSSALPVESLDEVEQAWSQANADNENEQERLRSLAADLTKAFTDDVYKSPSTVAEVVCLAPALDQVHFRRLLMNVIDGINQATLLETHLLDGLAQLMQCALPESLNADDLVRILEVLSTRLKDTHRQATQYIYKLTLAVSHVLDAMADCHFTDLNRVQLHEPLFEYLDGLKSSPDPYLVYQAAYAFQALQYVPDDESPLQATLRRARTVAKGISGMMSAVKAFNIIDGLEHLQDVVVEVYLVAKIGYSVAKSLSESGRDLFDCLSESQSFSKKRTWYPALRGIDNLIRQGQLTEVKKLICEAPHRRDIAFQWGVCQRLAEIATNPAWSSNTRRSAIDFLGELYKNDTEWGHEIIIKQWILNLLEQLASQTGSTMQAAEILLRELGADGDIKKQSLYQACLGRSQYQYPVAVAVPLLTSTSLLDRIQNKPDIEADLRQLKERRIKEQSDAVYIPPQAKSSLQAPDGALFPLMDKVKEFLNSDKKVMLLLGDFGAGKSTFSRELERDLWSTYKKQDGRIPLFINLAAIDRPEQDLITKHLRRAEFTDVQIRELKGYRKLVLICDGYDESQQTHNLYTSNRLNQPGEWNAQMVINCRSEALGFDYRDQFQPSDYNLQAKPELYQEAVIAPFSPDQVQEYIEKYVSTGTPWKVTDYLQALKMISSLQDLVKNPFMLTLTMEVLPRIVEPWQNLTCVQITRVALYDQFVEQWLERGKRRLRDKDMSSQARADFERLTDDGFTQNGLYFLKDLASAIYKHQAGYPVVTYSPRRDQGTWKQEFFSRKDEKQLLLEACPLTRNGNQYRFVHKSIQDYCLTRAVFEPQDEENARRLTLNHDLTPTHALARRGSHHSVESFENQDICEEPALFKPIERDLLDSPLAWRLFVGEPSIIQFLAERVQQESDFKQQLLAVVEVSKVNEEARKAAANAITILIRAGVRFNGKDLKGIQIPGADLSGGQFDSALLQGADLRNVNLCNIWLRQANLSNARMSGVQFGEWPYLEEDSMIYSCSYSPDGIYCVVGLYSGAISVYDTTTWEKIHTLHGHAGCVWSVTYSPSGNQIASGSADKTIRVWDAQTGVPDLILSDYTDTVTSVAFSPSGHQIAAGSDDKTVRLWDAQTGAPGLILNGHSHGITSVVYSPSGHQIASGSGDNTVRLWDARLGTPGPILSGHTLGVTSVAYSPNGYQLASGSYDETVRIWDAQTGAPGLVLSGHTDIIYSVMYSPSGHQIASGSADKTVRLWDAQTGTTGPILSGHTEIIKSMMYSPSGHQIISGGQDKTLRVWDAQTGASNPTLGDHTKDVTSVACSPSGHQIVSGSRDTTLRLWDAQTGTPGPVLIGHTDIVHSVTYSPSGHQIASGSWDGTVRLWDAETGAPSLTLNGHTEHVTSAVYSPRGHQIASGSRDKTVRLWDAQTGAPGPILSGHNFGITSVVYSPSGCQIASGSEDGTIWLWDTETGASTVILSGHTTHVASVTYSPNGRQIASASWDGTVQLWDAEKGAPSLILRGHTERVTSAVYSPSGRWITSGSNDKTARLWDVDSGQCLAVIEDGEVNSVAWNATLNGIYFVTGSDKSIRTWEIIDGDNHHQVRLHWGSMHGGFSVSNTSIQNSQGLSRVNIQLLKQHGAIDEPIPPLSFPETGRKLTGTASAASSVNIPAMLSIPCTL
ncbi:hypothetical protein BGZ98_007594 [Dissophora globulifera]|nr:hypothetical protein BGZ98_007594 [Dissophora globulifera]